MKENVVRMEGPIVLLRGSLQGRGRETACELLARKKILAGFGALRTRLYAYTECTLLKPPAGFPDGAYIVFTEDGFVVPITKEGHSWLMGAAQRLEEQDTQQFA